MSLAELLPVLPLPLAQMVRRSLHAKSAVERHHCGYYLGEAALKLAACVRVARVLADGPPAEPVAAAISRLAWPSTGDWLAVLRESERALGGRLEARRAWPAVEALARALAADDIVSREVVRNATRRGLDGFLGVLVTYRNKLLGHGAHRTPAFYSRNADLLLAALDEVLRDDAFVGEVELYARVASEEGDAQWRNLTGPVGVPVPAPDGASGDAQAGAVYARAGGRLVSLFPLAFYRDDPDLLREHVAFLNGTTVKRKSGEVKRVDYLDYFTGEPLDVPAARDAMAELLARVGRASDDAIPRVAAADDDGVVAAPGARFAGFEILERLGAGAMGVVYRANQEVAERIVALKILSSEVGDDEVMRRRFRREVVALARCDHPNVVKVMTCGEHSGRPYYAMELVDGEDLTSARLGDRNAPGFFRGVAERFAGVANGLAHIHEQGVLHRDVKPSNLVVTRDGDRLVLMDFGLAKLDDASSDLTGADAGVLGTLRYMAPEQLGSARAALDRRADVFALGATLFEVATGTPLRDADTTEGLYGQILSQRAIDPGAVHELVPAPLAAIIARATAHARDDRYPDAAAFAADLRAFAAGEPIAAAPAGRDTAPPAPRRWPLAAGAAVAIGAGVAAALAFGGAGGADDGAAGGTTDAAVRVAARSDAAPRRPPAPPEGMVRIDGGVFTIGSSQAERDAARALCGDAGGEDCERAARRIEREAPAHARRVEPFFLDRDEVSAAAFAAWLDDAAREIVTTPGDRPGHFDVVAREGDRDVLIARIHPLGTVGYDPRENRFRVAGGVAEGAPASYVTWDGALRYCLDARGTLPSESHWELAARGTDGRRFPWGDARPACDAVVFGRVDAAYCEPAATRPAGPDEGRGDVTPEGVRNLGGNVSEWVYDAFTFYEGCAGPCPSPAPDELGADATTERVVRGGNFVVGPLDTRGAGRSKLPQSTAAADIGFRCMRTWSHGGGGS